MGWLLYPLQQVPPDLPDPNALYAAVIQASATIVAIVGGFVTATVINIASERRSLEDEISDLEQECEDVQAELAGAEEERDRVRAQFLIWKRDEDAVGWGGPLPSADVARRRLRAEEVPPPVFEEEWSSFVTDVASARAAVDSYLQNYRDPNTSRMLELDEWLGTRVPQLSSRAERLADVIYEALNEEARRSSADAGPFASYRIPPITVPNQASVVSERERWEHDINRLTERCRDSTDEVRRLERDVERHRHRLRYARRAPPSLWLGMAALGLLALVGILFPLILMPQAATEYEPWHKLAVIGGFALGLVLSCWYVGWLLRHRGGSDGSARTLGAERS
jgi:outer membrane murein-binding lipoprotein Lpp